MMLEPAVRLTTGMMALAFTQQSLEHLRPAARLHERLLFAPRLCLALLLLASSLGYQPLGLGPQVLTLALGKRGKFPGKGSGQGSRILIHALDDSWRRH